MFQAPSREMRLNFVAGTEQDLDRSTSIGRFATFDANGNETILVLSDEPRQGVLLAPREASARTLPSDPVSQSLSAILSPRILGCAVRCLESEASAFSGGDIPQGLDTNPPVSWQRQS